MDWNAIQTIIGSLGFPICICIIILRYGKTVIADFQAQIKEMNELTREQAQLHKEEILQLKDTIFNNTLVIQQLCDHLSHKGE